MKFNFWQYCYFIHYKMDNITKWKTSIIVQPHFLHSSSFLFDLWLTQSIHFCWLFSRSLLASIFNKTRLKRDLVFHVVVIFIHYKMINLDSMTSENNKELNEKWPYVPDHPYRILIIGSSRSGKTNTLINLIK